MIDLSKVTDLRGQDITDWHAVADRMFSECPGFIEAQDDTDTPAESFSQPKCPTLLLTPEQSQALAGLTFPQDSHE